MTRTRSPITWILIGVTAALLAAVSAAATASAQDGPIPGGFYSGTLVDSGVSCSQGDFTLGEAFELRLNAQGTAIIEITDHEVTYLGSPIADASYGVDIPIASDGSFQDDFDVAGIVFTHIDGRFQGDTVSGSYRISVGGVVECDATFTAQEGPPPPPSPVTWDAPIDLRSDGCGGGVVSVTVGGDGTSLIAAAVTGLQADGELVAGSASFDEGTVPIAADGSFGWVYFPGSEPGQEIALSGTFAGGFSGLVTVSPSTCGPVGFGSSDPLAGFGLGGDVPDGAGDLRAAAGLPDTGGGAAADRGRIGLVATALAAAGVATLVLALALLRRRGV